MTIQGKVHNGSIELPPGTFLPEGLIVEVLVPITPEPSAQDDDARQQRIRDIFARLRASNPFRDIEDSVKWQREMREDRKLPWPE